MDTQIIIVIVLMSIPYIMLLTFFYIKDKRYKEKEKLKYTKVIDHIFINKVDRYTRRALTISCNDKLYIPPGIRARGARVKDVILYGVSCKELMDKEKFDRFIKWLNQEVFPAIRP